MSPPHRVAACLILALLSMATTAVAQSDIPLRTVLVVMDGLRPDYVTPELMPRLSAAAKEGVHFQNHHSVFPTVTRVNAASIATGCYPDKHGLMGNTIYLPSVNERPVSTSDYENLVAIETATAGQLLLAPSLGELLQAKERKLVVVSSGSSGSAYLLNHKVAGGAIINNDFTMPAALEPRVLELLGPVPRSTYPNTERVQRVADGVLKVALDELSADVVIAWITDPDHTAHKHGIGDSVTNEALKNVDNAFGRILDGIADRGLAERTNVLVTSDHGFSTFDGKANPYFAIGEIIRDLGLDPKEVVQSEFGFYLSGEAKRKENELTLKLQELDWMGGVFTQAMSPGVYFGTQMGTLSMDAIHYGNDRAPDILAVPGWSDKKNEHGFAGSTKLMGAAGHGTGSPFDIHNTLIAVGPGFRKGIEIAQPTSNVDLAPTILYLHRLEYPLSMQGRVIKEALTTGPDPASVSYIGEVTQSQVSFIEGGSYKIELQFTKLGDSTYIDKSITTHSTEFTGFIPPLITNKPPQQN